MQQENRKYKCRYMNDMFFGYQEYMEKKLIKKKEKGKTG